MGKGNRMNGDKCKLNFLVGEHIVVGFHGGSDGKESACNTGDLGLISGTGRVREEGNGHQIGRASCRERV